MYLLVDKATATKAVKLVLNVKSGQTNNFKSRYNHNLYDIEGIR